MRPALELALGAVVGFWGWRAFATKSAPIAISEPGRPVTQSPVARTPAETAPTRPCVQPPSPSVSPDQLQEAWLGEWQSFVEAWGTPTQTPANWTPEAEAKRIRERLGQMRLDLVEVDCEFHPCVAVVAKLGEIDLDELRAVAGVGPGTVRIGEAWSESASAEVGTITFVPPSVEPSEAKWARRLADRLQVRLEGEISTLLSEP